MQLTKKLIQSRVLGRTGTVSSPSSLAGPDLEYPTLFWEPRFIKASDNLMKSKNNSVGSYEEMFKELKTFSLKKTRFHYHIRAFLKNLKGYDPTTQ